MHYWWVGLGNVIGSTILAYYWDDFAPALATDWDKINLLKTFGPMGGLLVTYLLLFTALMLIIGWEKRFFRRAAPQTAKEIDMKMSFLITVLIWWVEPSPYPAVATLEAMPQLKKGEILEVVSDCPQSINNIPLDARNHGYTVLDIQQDGPTIRYLIQK